MQAEQAFTIVELIVVLAVASVILALSLPAFYAFQRKSALTAASHAFAQDLRRAQNMGLSAQQYVDSTGTVQPVDGYGAEVDLDRLGNAKYTLYADKSPGNKQYDASDYTVATVTLPSGIIIRQINNVTGNNASVDFNASNARTVLSPLSSGAQSIAFVFAESGYTSITKTVSVNASGLIEVK